MRDLDLEQFWRDDEAAHRDNCFSEEAPQVALGIRMSPECVFAELGVPGDPWNMDSLPGRTLLQYYRAYNDRAERIVGRRLLPETLPPEDAAFPAVRRIGEIFGGRYRVLPQAGEWLSGDIETLAGLEKTLDRVDRLDIRSFMLPARWESEKKRIYEQYGVRPPQLRGIRGPVTLATSLMGEQNFIYLYYDARELFERFGRTIQRVIIEMGDVMDAEAYPDPAQAPPGFGFADDNCCLLTPEMYERFGYPILRGVFEHFSPGPGDVRYQHSDSAMGHLLPILGRLGLTGCNFGPTVMAEEIRKHLPAARIDGCLAPFTFMRNDPGEILAEVRRDCEGIRRTGTRGLNLTTAGSINNGSLLTSMRTVMEGILRYGRY